MINRTRIWLSYGRWCHEFSHHAWSLPCTTLLWWPNSWDGSNLLRMELSFLLFSRMDRRSKKSPSHNPFSFGLLLTERCCLTHRCCHLVSFFSAWHTVVFRHPQPGDALKTAVGGWWVSRMSSAATRDRSTTVSSPVIWAEGKVNLHNSEKSHR